MGTETTSMRNFLLIEKAEVPHWCEEFRWKDSALKESVELYFILRVVVFILFIVLKSINYYIRRNKSCRDRQYSQNERECGNNYELTAKFVQTQWLNKIITVTICIRFWIPYPHEESARGLLYISANCNFSFYFKHL